MTQSSSRERSDPAVVRVVETVLPTRHGTFRMIGHLGHDGTEHVSLSMGIADRSGPVDPPLVRLHSECLTGDVLGSRRCDCGTQLGAALARIAAEGIGALICVRGHEGRGIELLEKLKAYRLQDRGVDTVDANLALGHPSDARDYAQAAAIVRDLRLPRIRLMSSNPAKETALRAHGITVVERTGLFVPEFSENVRYLATKRARMGHDAPGRDAWGELLAGRVPVSAATEADADLIDRYGPLVAAGEPLVIAQMAQSLDGFIATRTGDGVALSGPEDHVHLHRLRALVDAVVVGAGSVTADDPRLTVREVDGDNPVRVVLDPHARIPRHSRLLTDGLAPTLWVVASTAEVPDGAGPGVEVLRLGSGRVEPKRLVHLLAARGCTRVLVEGGGETVSRFLVAGCLDRLFVTTVPLFLGDGIPGVRVPAAARVADGLRPLSRSFALGADICTEFTLS